MADTFHPSDIPSLHLVDHPLIQHKLTIMRQKETGTKEFRELLSEIAMLMAYEITRDFPLRDVEIETPVAKCRAKMLEGKKLGIVPILRAGLGMLDGILTSFLPHAWDTLVFTATPRRWSRSSTMPNSRAVSRIAHSSCQTRCSPRAAVRQRHSRCSNRRAHVASSSCVSYPLRGHSTRGG